MELYERCGNEGIKGVRWWIIGGEGGWMVG